MRLYSGEDYGACLIMSQEELLKLQEQVSELHEALIKHEAPNLNEEFIIELDHALEG